MKKKIGILGGTFNPPHIGHLILAQEIAGKLELDRIVFVPAYRPPHKRKISLPESAHRLKMVSLSVGDNPLFSCSDIEVKRKGVSYTVDTLEEIRKRFPGDEIYLIIGSDLARGFDTWRDYKRILSLARVVVARREDFARVKAIDGFHRVINVLEIKVSSSLIRGLIKKGFSVKYLVHPDVERYIKIHGLYV